MVAVANDDDDHDDDDDLGSSLTDRTNYARCRLHERGLIFRVARRLGLGLRREGLANWRMERVTTTQ